MNAPDLKLLYSNPFQWLKSRKDKGEAFYGKIVLNCCDSDVPAIHVEERLNKPINPKMGKES